MQTIAWILNYLGMVHRLTNTHLPVPNAGYSAGFSRLRPLGPNPKMPERWRNIIWKLVHVVKNGQHTINSILAFYVINFIILPIFIVILYLKHREYTKNNPGAVTPAPTTTAPPEQGPVQEDSTMQEEAPKPAPPKKPKRQQQRAPQPPEPVVPQNQSKCCKCALLRRIGLQKIIIYTVFVSRSVRRFT